MFHVFHHNRFGVNLAFNRLISNGLEAWKLALRLRGFLRRSVKLGLRAFGMVLALLQPGVHAQTVPAKPATSATAPTNGFFVPAGIFGRLAVDAKASAANASAGGPASVPALLPYLPSVPMVQRVLLYASPTTRAFMASGGFDAADNIRTWEVFLRKYRIPFQVLPGVEQLEKAQPGVLLLPSSVALSEREKKAVIDFRANGGSVLATWLTGIRGENGEWRGFDFMQGVLGAKVVGNTEIDEDDIFMMPHGDSPVTHNLPAGLRIWLQRVGPWYPLRLVARHTAANIMPWSRAISSEKPSATITFDEQIQASGRPSRTVVLGYPERLWLSADPKSIEAIAHNSLMWLLRQPEVYVAAWPHPYTSAFVLAVDSVEVSSEADLSFAKQFEDLGGRASYYVLSENVKNSADVLKKIQARGHELAVMADRFKGFKDQSAVEQAKRLDAARRELREAGLDIAAGAGFHAPMESHDQTTERLLGERAFGYFVAFMDRSETRLPFFVPSDAAAAKPSAPMVGLPRTVGGPDDEDRDPVTAVAEFFHELDLATQMGSLSVVRTSNQSSLDPAQAAEFFKGVKARSNRMWLVPGGQVADWWRERARVGARLGGSAVAPLMTVTITDGAPMKQPAAVWVNLPHSGATLRLVPSGTTVKLPKIASVDAWRSALVLDGFPSGEYQWYLYFDRPTTNVGK